MTRVGVGAKRLAGALDWAIARRFLAGHGSGLLGSTARVALVASTLGVAAMGIAMALMTGYRGELERKLVGGSAAVQVFPPAEALGESAYAELRQSIAGLPGVRAVEAVSYLQGVLSSGRGEAEVTLRGVEPGTGLLGASADQLARDEDGLPGVVLGHELAAALATAPGDRLRLTALVLGDGGPRFVFRSVRASGTFTSGFSEFDRSWGLVAKDALETLAPRALASLEVRLEEPERAAEIAEAIRGLAPEALVTDWRENNRELFSALTTQQVALFLLLGLIVLVSTFNVASSLVVLVRERQRDLGALAALGLPPRRLRRVFLLYGGALGAAGTLLGLGFAAIVSWALDRFEVIRFGADVASIYFLSAVPFRLSLIDATAIGLFSILVTFLSCWLPSRRAFKLDPATALRYE